LNRIANRGRVSNPVPVSAGPKAERAPEGAVSRRTWRAENLLEAVVPEFELEDPLNAMLTERERFGFERVCSNNRRLIFERERSVLRVLMATDFTVLGRGRTIGEREVLESGGK